VKKLSLITTVYNKDKVVTKQLSNLYQFLTAKRIDFEIIVVIDGKQENTKRKINDLIKGNGYTRIIVYAYDKNMGKGYAIRYGIDKANAEIIGYIDADCDIDLKTLNLLLYEMKNGASVTIPSKYHKDSAIKFPLIRKIISKGFLLANKILVSLPKGVDDVSCGVKLFKGELLKQINPYLTVNGFAIDSEILYFINKLKVPVKVVPFFANINTNETTVTLSKTIRVGIDIFKLFTNRFKFSRGDKEIHSPILNIETNSNL
jgi:dolichyl-phosphate beta-glucosyltransferase